MKRNLGAIPAVYPMPVLIIAAYGEDGKIELMNAAWGTACEVDKLALFISKGHKTTQSILKTGAFSVSIADREHMAAADYVGIATGNKTPDKFARTGLTASKSAFVNSRHRRRNSHNLQTLTIIKCFLFKGCYSIRKI